MTRFLVVASLAIVFSPQTRAQGQPGLPNPALQRIGRGMYSIGVERLVQKGAYVFTEEPPCGTGESSVITRFTKSATASMRKHIRSPLVIAALAIANLVAPEIDKWLDQQAGWTSQQLRGSGYANCASLVVVVPRGSRIVSVEYFVGDGDRGIGNCWLEGNGIMICGNGPRQRYHPGVDYCSWGRQQDRSWNERTKRNQTGTIVTAVFKNWSGGDSGRARWASMIVHFVPPPKWKPVQYRT